MVIAERIDTDTQIEALQAIIRPTWAVGISNQELASMARSEGLNPYQQDWYDAIDSKVIRETRAGHYRDPNAPTITELKAARKPVARKRKPKSKRRSWPTKGKRDKMTPDQAITFEGFSIANTLAVLATLECDCQPYMDVFTLGRWIAQGRAVMKGQKAIKIPKYKSIEREDEDTGEVKVISIPCGSSSVFCRCQTQAR